LTVTVGVGEVLGVTGVTLVDLSSSLVVDLGRLTVGHIDVGGGDLTTRFTVLAQGEWDLASKALGLGTDGTLSVKG